MKIGLCMIVKNDEHVIERVMRSALPFFRYLGHSRHKIVRCVL